MSSPIANAQILRRVLGCFILTTAIAGVAVSYALLAVTFTPTTSTLALLLPGRLDASVCWVPSHIRLITTITGITLLLSGEL
jgi:hypothetical protein